MRLTIRGKKKKNIASYCGFRQGIRHRGQRDTLESSGIVWLSREDSEDHQVLS